MLVVAERVQSQGVGRADRRLDLVLVDEDLRAAAQAERRRRMGRSLGRERTVLGFPFVETAVEDRDVVEAHGAQHPPDAAGPHRRGVTVEHDEGAVADALGGECLGELLERRQGEAQLRVLVGEVALQVEEGGARDVTLVVVGATAFGDVAAVGAGLEVGGAVEHSHRRRAELAREVFRRNQVGRLGHATLP